jgi:signal transduction histidine kinase
MGEDRRTDGVPAAPGADRSARVQAAIAACAHHFAETRDLHDILRSAVPVISEQLGLDRVGIFLYREEEDRWLGAFGAGEGRLLQDGQAGGLAQDARTPLGKALRSGCDEWFSGDFEQEFPGVPYMRGVKEHLLMVLRAHGRLLGAISADNRLTQRPIDEATREDVRRFARYIALAIENCQLADRLNQQNRILSAELEMRRKAEAAREAVVRELHRANTELSEFAHVVSHDLKAPLRGMVSLANWLLEDYAKKLDPAGVEQLRLLVARGRRLQRLVDGILRCSQVGRSRVKPREVGSGELAQQVADALAPPAGIRVTVLEPMPRVRYDPTQLEQVFQNLIGNAIVHMGKPEGAVTVGCREGGDEWEFFVRDTGPGLSREDAERVFTPFLKLGGTSPEESTGLGLALVKKIVESNHGAVRVESERGRGSTFTFTVPKSPVTMGGEERAG